MEAIEIYKVSHSNKIGQSYSHSEVFKSTERYNTEDLNLNDQMNQN